MLEVWQRYVDRHLQYLCRVIRDEYDGQYRRSMSMSFSGRLEMTLPWGMDDGNGLVILTLVDASFEGQQYDRWRFRVILSADSAGFGEPLRVVHFGQPDESWYWFVRKAQETRRTLAKVPDTITGRLIQYLRHHNHGDSLCQEEDGSLSFTMAITSF